MWYVVGGTWYWCGRKDSEGSILERHSKFRVMVQFPSHEQDSELNYQH